jgi:hypothetical protein
VRSIDTLRSLDRHRPVEEDTYEYPISVERQGTRR